MINVDDISKKGLFARQMFDVKEGAFYIYKNNLVQVTKIDKHPYKCSIYNDTGKVCASKWVNSIDLIPIESISKKTFPQRLAQL